MYGCNEKENGGSQQWQLYQAYYQMIRELYGLPANPAIGAVVRVAPKLKKKNLQLKEEKSSLFPFLPKQIVFDLRTFLLKRNEWAAALTLLNGRENIIWI